VLAGAVLFRHPHNFRPDFGRPVLAVAVFEAQDRFISSFQFGRIWNSRELGSRLLSASPGVGKLGIDPH
jgi:hypothetical protein